MVQVKKSSVDQAILNAADVLFRANGFSATPMAAIARHAGVAVSTIYVYYGSKLELFFMIYEPWLTRQIDEMEAGARRGSTPFARVRSILEWTWVKIPSSDNYFSNNLIEAISTAGPADAYSDGFLKRVRQRLSQMLRDAVPGGPGQAVTDELAFMIVMAFDGLSIKISRSGKPASAMLLDIMAGMICTQLGEEVPRPVLERHA